MSKRVVYFLLTLLLGSIACQATNLVRMPRLAEPSPTFEPSTTPNPPSSTPSASPTAPPTFPSTLQPTATLTPTATPVPTATIVPTSSPRQREVFEELWQIVKDEYLYRDFNGLDWDAVHETYSQMIESGMTNENFYFAMYEMINSLGDDHSVFLDPTETRAGESEYAGEYDYAGIGLLNSAVPERSRLVVILVFPGSPAEIAGIKIHDSILAIDGESVLDENGFRTQSLRGPVGSDVTLTIETPGGEPHDVTMKREQITGSMPVPYELLETEAGKKVGYILLASFSDQTIVGEVEDAIKELTVSGPLDGLIIDNRENPGGADTIVRGVLANFTRGTVGYFVNRDKKRAFNIVGQDINGSQDLPLVVLVGRDTVSFGEIFPGILQDLGRAYIMGQTTDGNVETLYIYDFPDGSSAWIAHDTFQALNDPTLNWEETGIIPDQTVLSEWDQVTLDTDPVIQAALDHFDQ